MKSFIKFIALLFTFFGLPSLILNILWLVGYFPFHTVNETSPVWASWIFMSTCMVTMFMILIIISIFQDVWHRDQDEIDEYKRSLYILEREWKNKLYE